MLSFSALVREKSEFQVSLCKPCRVYSLIHFGRYYILSALTRNVSFINFSLLKEKFSLFKE